MNNIDQEETFYKSELTLQNIKYEKAVLKRCKSCRNLKVQCYLFGKVRSTTFRPNKLSEFAEYTLRFVILNFQPSIVSNYLALLQNLEKEKGKNVEINFWFATIAFVSF